MDKKNLVDAGLMKTLEEHPEVLSDFNKILISIAKNEDEASRDRTSAINLFLDSNGLKKNKVKAEDEQVPLTQEEREKKLRALGVKVGGSNGND